MPTISGDVNLPSGLAVKARVDVELWGDGRTVTGFVTGNQIVSTYTTLAAHDGTWSVAVAYGNTAITPAGTVYRVVYTWPGGNAEPFYVTVPTGGGPYDVGTILTSPPGSIASPGSASVASVDALDVRVDALEAAGGGDSVVLTRTAAVTLGGHRVVTPNNDGTVRYASNDMAGDATRPLWLTLGAATAGNPVQVVALGEVVEPSWSWTAGAVFLATNGLLTQTPPTLPTAAFLVQVGSVSTVATALFFDPQPPIALS